jgi:hypothetical protein
MEVLVDGLAVIIPGLVISLAIAAFVIESGQPPKMFRLPFIFEVQAAYVQQQQQTTTTGGG